MWRVLGQGKGSEGLYHKDINQKINHFGWDQVSVQSNILSVSNTKQCFFYKVSDMVRKYWSQVCRLSLMEAI